MCQKKIESRFTHFISYVEKYENIRHDYQRKLSSGKVNCGKSVLGAANILKARYNSDNHLHIYVQCMNCL